MQSWGKEGVVKIFYEQLLKDAPLLACQKA